MIIGLVGFAGSGKGTVGEVLVNEFGYEQFAFADSLKDAVSAIFGWDRHLLEGDTEESRLFREKTDEYWSDCFGTNITPRMMLQKVGTEAMRDVIHNDIWINSLEYKIMKKSNVVITDVRFPNEIRSIRRMNGKIIRVARGPEPPWYDTAMTANMYNNPAIMNVEFSHVHLSEWAWIGSVLDYTIRNDGSKDELMQSVRNMLQNFKY